MLTPLVLAAVLARPPSNNPPLFIPVVAHAGPDISELRLFNGGTRDEVVTLIFTPDGADGATTFSTARVAVPAKHVVAIPDIVGDSFSMEGVGSLELTGDIPDILATSRMGNQLIPPVRYGGGAWITMLQSTPDFRSNLGMTEVSGGRGTVHVTLKDPAGATVGDSYHEILPFAHVQFPVSGAPLMRAEFEVNGTASVATYASVIDRRSGAATLVLPDFIGASDRCVVPVISMDGANGTHWRSELVAWSSSAAFHLDFYDARKGDVVEGYEFVDGNMVHFDDVVSSRFGRHDTYGTLQMWLHGFVLIGLRTYSIGPGGTRGELILTTDLANTSRAPLAYGHGARQLLFVEQDEGFRTNIGAIGGGESDSWAILRFTAYDAAGNALGSTERTVRQYEFVQFPVTEITKAPLSGGRLEVEVLFSHAGGVATAWASVVDNTTGTPMFVGLQ